MDDADAVHGLKRLGLTTYEARVFLALQKLGSATAAEVHDVADVPRSQVYGAAEGLEEQGLVEIQQSTPTVYRPVSLERARSRLLDRLERAGTSTFDYLETVQQSAPADEQSESIWLVRGGEAVTARVVELADEADSRLLYGAPSPAELDDRVVEALEGAAERGVSVAVASSDPAVVEAAAPVGGVEGRRIPPERTPDVPVSRVLLVDDRTILLSVFTSADVAEPREVAFWSVDSAFAAVLVDVTETWLAVPAA